MIKFALFLVIVGALNWLLWGVLEINLVEAITGGFNFVSRAIYVLVGVAGLYSLRLFFDKPCNLTKKTS